MRVTREFTVWCEADNHNWHQSSQYTTKRKFIAGMKKGGWKVIGGVTHCPECASRRPEEEEK